MSGARDGLNAKGVAIPSLIQNTDQQVGDDGTIYLAPGFGLPALTTNTIMAYNPYTNEFWAAGNGLGVDDKG